MWMALIDDYGMPTYLNIYAPSQSIKNFGQELIIL